MSADFVTRYARFTGGDWGLTDASKAREGQWRGENIMLADSQLLSMRPGLATLNITGLGNHPNDGSPRGFEHWDGGLVVVTDQPYWVKHPTSKNQTVAAEALGTFDSPASGKCHMAQMNGNLYINVDGDIYKYEAATHTKTKISTPVALNNLTRWGYYLVAVRPFKPWQIFYTDVGEAGADPDSWNINNFLEVGSNGHIRSLAPMYNYLYCGKPEGWWAVSGVLAERPYTRPVTVGNGPPLRENATITTDNRVLYWGHDNAPMWFNGDNSYFDAEFRISSVERKYPTNAVAASPFGRRCFLLGEPADQYDALDATTGMLMYDNGDWTTHEFPFPLGGIAGHDPRDAIDRPPSVMFFINRARQSNPVQIYTLDTSLDRPARTSDKYADPYDIDGEELVTGNVELPAFYDSQSRMVMARSVVVQFRHWPNQVANSNNELQCYVRPLGRYEGGALENEAQIWVAPAESAADGGSDETWRIGAGNIGWANGFQVVFPRMRGVALRSVEVHCEVRTPRL